MHTAEGLISIAMTGKILISGDRADFTTLELDESANKLRILANYTAPHNANWTELVSSPGGVDHFIGISESEDSPKVYTFQIDHAQQTCQITSQRSTSDGPCHGLFSSVRSLF